MKDYIIKWSHFYIALIGMIALTWLGEIWLRPQISALIVMAVLVILQWLNEYYQKHSEKEIANHGGMDAFLFDSGRDWKHCFGGIGLGLIVSAIRWVVL